MRSVYEQKIVDAFLNEYMRNGNNAINAYDTLDYQVFVEHYYEFNSLSDETQWEIREIMFALKKIYK